MPEAELQESVRALAKQLGLRMYHTHTSRHSPAGFPDCVILGAGRVMFRELKRQRGKPTPDQQCWLDGLAACGEDTGVWRPSDWLSGRVQAELTELATRTPTTKGEPT
jgi:hypothetical protein